MAKLTHKTEIKYENEDKDRFIKILKQKRREIEIKHYKELEEVKLKMDELKYENEVKDKNMNKL